MYDYFLIGNWSHSNNSHLPPNIKLFYYLPKFYLKVWHFNKSCLQSNCPKLHHHQYQEKHNDLVRWQKDIPRLFQSFVQTKQRNRKSKNMAEMKNKESVLLQQCFGILRLNKTKKHQCIKHYCNVYTALSNVQCTVHCSTICIALLYCVQCTVFSVQFTVLQC